MMISFLLCLSGLLAFVQDADVTTAPTSADIAARTQSLKARIHGMRMNLLVGGDQVRRAEADAIDFYQSRIEALDQALDSIEAELSEKRTSYDLALDHALKASDSSARRAAMADASTLQARIASLEAEQQSLARPRQSLVQRIDLVRVRERERTVLAAQMESSGGLDDAAAFPLGGLGLAPDEPESGTVISSALIEDLLRRDPLRARRLLYETDPEGYWKRFGLQPPTEPLLQALPFPSPDPPGWR